MHPGLSFTEGPQLAHSINEPKASYIAAGGPSYGAVQLRRRRRQRCVLQSLRRFRSRGELKVLSDAAGGLCWFELAVVEPQVLVTGS